MGNNNTPRKRVKRLFDQMQTQTANLFGYLQTIQAFHEGRETETDLHEFIGVVLDRLAEISILIDVARFRFKTGDWPEKDHVGPNDGDQVRGPGTVGGNAVGADEAGDDGEERDPACPSSGDVGKPVDPGDAGTRPIV